MKVTTFFLPSNKKLLVQLDRQYSNTVHIFSEEILMEISDYFNVIFNELQKGLGSHLYKILVATVDKILLDNMLKYVVNKDSNRLLGLTANNQLAMDVFVNPFYMDELLNVITMFMTIKEEDRYDINNVLRKYIYNLINNTYKSDTNLYNAILCNLYMEIESIICNISIDKYKVELGDHGLVVLFYSERNPYACCSN